MFAQTFRKRLMRHLHSIFDRRPCRIQVAALPWRRTADGIEVLLVTSRGTGRWIIPKGWPEASEPFFDAAAREAGEEAGIGGAVSTDVLGSYFYDKTRASGQEIKCEVKVFPLEVETVADHWRERHQRKRRWVAPEKAVELVDEPELAALISRFSAAPSHTIAA